MGSCPSGWGRRDGQGGHRTPGVAAEIAMRDSRRLTTMLDTHAERGSGFPLPLGFVPGTCLAEVQTRVGRPRRNRSRRGLRL